jgi:rhamnulokinase
MQMVATKEFESIEAGRQCILDSFTFSKHLPQTCDHEVLEKYKKFIEKRSKENE